MCPTTSELTSLGKNSPNPTKPLLWPAGTNARPRSPDPRCSLLHKAACSLAACPSSTCWGASCVGPHPGSLLGVPVISSLCCSALSTEACPGHPVHECTLCLFFTSCFIFVSTSYQYLAHICLQSASLSLAWELPGAGRAFHSPLSPQDLPSQSAFYSLRAHRRVTCFPRQQQDQRTLSPSLTTSGNCTRGPCHIQWLIPACHSGFCEGGVWLPRAGAN